MPSSTPRRALPWSFRLRDSAERSSGRSATVAPVFRRGRKIGSSSGSTAPQRCGAVVGGAPPRGGPAPLGARGLGGGPRRGSRSRHARGGGRRYALAQRGDPTEPRELVRDVDPPMRNSFVGNSRVTIKQVG